MRSLPVSRRVCRSLARMRSFALWMILFTSCATEAGSTQDVASGSAEGTPDAPSHSEDVASFTDVAEVLDGSMPSTDGQSDVTEDEVTPAGCEPACGEGEVCVRGRVCAPAVCEDSCRDDGKCTLGKESWSPVEVCVVGGSADCEVSDVCEELGECTAYRKSEFDSFFCVVGAESDADCTMPHGTKGNSPCESVGMCTAEGGACINTSDEDCRKSTFCKLAGYCNDSPDSPFCTALSDEDCKQSDMCAYAGSCRYLGGLCASGSDADCAQSEVCKTEGRCKYKPLYEAPEGMTAPGTCVTPEELEGDGDAQGDGDGR